MTPSGDVYHSTPFHTPENNLLSATVLSSPEAKPEPVAEPVRSGNSPTRGKKGSAQHGKPTAASVPDPQATSEVNVQETSEKRRELLPVSWDVIGASGERLRINEKQEEEYFDDLLMADATCFETDQVFLRITFFHCNQLKSRRSACNNDIG